MTIMGALPPDTAVLLHPRPSVAFVSMMTGLGIGFQDSLSIIPYRSNGLWNDDRIQQHVLPQPWIPRIIPWGQQVSRNMLFS